MSPFSGLYGMLILLEVVSKCLDTRHDEHLSESVHQYVERERTGVTTYISVFKQTPIEVDVYGAYQATSMFGKSLVDKS